MGSGGKGGRAERIQEGEGPGIYTKAVTHHEARSQSPKQHFNLFSLPPAWYRIAKGTRKCAIGAMKEGVDINITFLVLKLKLLQEPENEH